MGNSQFITKIEIRTIFCCSCFFLFWKFPGYNENRRNEQFITNLKAPPEVCPTVKTLVVKTLVVKTLVVKTLVVKTLVVKTLVVKTLVERYVQQ